ncbi:MAG TPA: protein kinase [Thermoanaerobaculia bacterium]|nr:protein kinase [Thermoanaerobaculia bacterium]
MTLSAGTRLGPYEVLGPLGAGGMGEVYRARDDRLGREVAIKVLPSELSSDSSRLKRFEKEARSASALNHPNIVTIYDIGTSDSISWIAMERVDGKTLRELLFSGPLPIKRLLQTAAQIADGLARAHEAGIVHRDLKPENVMVTKDGLVKILDFGLAKLTYSGVGSDEGSHLPTETGTSPGVVLGTVGYMSPEQAGAQPLDFHSDQFSFGSILYEMATGKRAFQKKTGVDTLAAILNEEPEPIGVVSPASPAPLRWIIERCLAKEPAERYGTTRDLARDLVTLRDHLSEAAGVPSAPLPRSRPWFRPWLVAVAIVLAVGAALLAGKQLSKTPLPMFRPLTFQRGSIWSARFAPDGQTIVYSASWNGEPKQLYSTRLGSPESRSLPYGGADVAAISSSGEMALVKDGVLSKVPLAGGGARQVLEDVLEADWSPDGSNFAVVHRVTGRARLEYPIGRVLYETSGLVHGIRVSPRGDRVAFFDSPLAYDDRGSLAVVDLTGKKTTLSSGWFSTGPLLAWSPGGNEIWFGGLRRGGLRGELYGISLTGRERTVLRVPGSFVLWDFSRDGRALMQLASCRVGLVGLFPGQTRERDLSWFDISELRDLSADGKTVLFNESGEGGNSTFYAVYTRPTDGSPAVRIGEGTASGLSPDGRWAITTLDTSPQKLTLLPTGPGEARTLERGPIEEYLYGAGWFPDGKRIWFNGRETGHGLRAYAQNIDGGGPQPLLPEGIRACVVSPDGKLFAARHEQGPSFAAPTSPVLFYSNEGQPVALAHDLPPNAEPSVFSADSRFLFALGYGEIPTPIYRLDLRNGKKELWKELAPPDRAGLEGIGKVCLTPDGRSFAYSYQRCQNDLYLVGGLK